MSVKVEIEGTIGTDMEFAGLPELWLKGQYHNGWIFSGGTREGQELSIKKVWEELITGTPLPFDTDLRLSNINLQISIGNNTTENGRDYKLKFNASVAFDFNPSDSFESQLNFETISFVYDKSASDENKTKIELSLKGNANLNNEIVIPDFSLDYKYFHNPESNTTEWHIDSTMNVLAFQRLMAFNARAASLTDEQTLHFSFESTNPVLHTSYFNRIKNIEPALLLRELNGGKAPDHGHIPLSGVALDAVDKLGPEYSNEQKTEIAKIITQARKANDALIKIPDIFNPEKTICSVSPKLFKLNITRKNKRFESFDFAIGSDLSVYNACNNYSELFKMEDGVVSTGYNKTENYFYFKFTYHHLHLKPFSAIAAVPGLMPLINEAFGETTGNNPKASAFINMLEVHPKDFTFIKKDKDWQLSGGLKLILTDKLQQVDKGLYEFVEKLFPKTGDSRYISGGINYDTKNGLTFVFENNNGIEVPDIFNHVVSSLDDGFKKSFLDLTKINLDEASDLGESFIILDRVRFKINKEASFDMRVGIGLPSKLNDRLFNKQSKIHGLINTYNRQKYKEAHAKDQTKIHDFDKNAPDDNLIRANLIISTNGIEGEIEKFNVFNLDKISEEFKGFIKIENEGVELDFNALTLNGAKKYAKLKLDKPTFKLDFKTCAFQFSGGMQLLSDELSLPVKPFLKKLIALLPPGELVKELNKITDVFTDSVTIKTLDFYDKDKDTLSIDGLLAFLKQFLGPDYQQSEIIPKTVLDLINNNLSYISKVLPTMLLEYLSIKMPAGIKFNIEVTADQSVSFALEAIEPTEAQKQKGYSDYLQCLLPTFNSINGFRLKKIGLGSGLFNQAIRLDLSGEMVMIDYLHTVPGVALSVIRQANPNDARLLHMTPDVKIFGYRYQLENLLMLIFPQTSVPIPVPVFYDNFAMYGAGIEGGKSEFRIQFPKPKINVAELFKSIGDIVNFFKTKEFALPIANYGVERKAGQTTGNNTLAFYAGPVYTELPGILGYEKQPDGSRKKITLGFKNSVGAGANDLFALAANSVKFGVLSIADKTYHKIRIDDTRSEYPVNYLVKFLPDSQRIGVKNIVLFDVLDANFVWALSTPGEFTQTVFPLIQAEQKRSGVSGKSDTWLANELLNIIPDSDKWTAEQDGVVMLLKGGVKISESFIIEAVTATAISAQNGFSTGLSVRANLANIFDFEIAGGLSINPENKDKIVSLSGKSHLYILNKVPVMKGTFLLTVGAQSQFTFEGKLDLFPDELFGGQRSPIQLYSGVSRNIKSEIKGVINGNGINVGFFNSNGQIEPAGLHLEIGELYLSGTTRIISTATQQLWEVKLRYSNTELALSAVFTNVDGGTDMLFKGSLNQPVGIEGILIFSGTEPGSGAQGRLLIFKGNGAEVPQLKEFYLNGKIWFLGFEASLVIAINATFIEFDLGSSYSFAGLQSGFALKSKLARDYSSFYANANFDVGLSFTIPKISFWVWFFGWHEVVLFEGCEWNSKFNTQLDINIYNPNAVKDAIDYDAELRMIEKEIAEITANQDSKIKELENKINGYENLKKQYKTDLEKKAELEKRIEELRGGLLSLQIIDDLFEAREKKGSDSSWEYHYKSARDAYFGIAKEYTGLLDQIGFSDTEQRKLFFNRLEYLEKVFDYIIVQGNRKWSYSKYDIDKVKTERTAPDYDVLLQFVLEAYNYKMEYLQKHNITSVPVAEEDAQILKMQANISDINNLKQLFWARNSRGSDPEWENVYKSTKEKIFGAINAYSDYLTGMSWKNEEQKQLYCLRVNYLNKIKENVIVYGYRLNGYTQTYVEDALIRGKMPDYDIILPVLAEIEKIKNDLLAKAGSESLYELNDLPRTKLPEGFGFNDSNYEKTLKYNRLLTKDGLYDYLKEEILTNEITLRKLNERKADVETQRKNNQNRQAGELRFELILQSSLNINGRIIKLPKVTILAAPPNLQNIIENLGVNVLATIKNNIWNTILDAFKPKKEDLMADSEGAISNGEEYQIIWHKETIQSDSMMMLADVEENNNKPEGYLPENDLTKYVKYNPNENI